MNLKTLIFVFLFAFQIVCQCVFSQGDIPIWKVFHPDHPDRISYLMGTVHVMPKHFRLPEYIPDLIDACATVIIEADIASVNPWDLVERCFYAPDSKNSLKDEFSPEQWARVLKLATILKIPESNLLKFKPWYLYTEVSIPDKFEGVQMDTEVQKYAKANEMELKYLEKISEQFDLFCNMPRSEVCAMILEMSEDIEKSWQDTRNIQAAFMSCDLEKLNELVHGSDFRTKFPVSYKMLFAQRNARWMPALKESLTAGNCFIAVGIGHILGESSLPELLKSLGYRVEKHSSKKE